MSVSAIAPVGSNPSASVYALATVDRPSAPAVAAPDIVAAQPAVVASAAALDTTPVSAAEPAAPFANPAIDVIAKEADVAANLSGDLGVLVQSYGAVALATATLALGHVFPQRNAPAIPPPAAIERLRGLVRL